MQIISIFWKKYFLGVVFCLVIFVIGLLNVPALYEAACVQYDSKTLNTSIAENTYNDHFWNKLGFVDLQGLVSRFAGQKINNDVIKGNDGKLNLMDNLDYKFIENVEKKKVQKAVKILEHAEKQNAQVLYVQRPWSTGQVPYGYEFELDTQYDYWCNEMEASGFPVLDLRKDSGENIEFYMTDHHWTIESSFYANQEIISKLNTLYSLGLDKNNKYTNIDDYEQTCYKDVFLGSEGIRTGKYFAGKDNFEIITPKFETDFSYTALKDHELLSEETGNYEDVFIDFEKLNDPEYNNKYNTIMEYGYVENIIVNHKAENDLKVMLIADSFARPMATYMACNFKELRYLDPQEGRYTDSYVEYIEGYNPDIVIMVFPGDGTFKEI